MKRFNDATPKPARSGFVGPEEPAVDKRPSGIAHGAKAQVGFVGNTILVKTANRSAAHG